MQCDALRHAHAMQLCYPPGGRGELPICSAGNFMVLLAFCGEDCFCCELVGSTGWRWCGDVNGMFTGAGGGDHTEVGANVGGTYCG